MGGGEFGVTASGVAFDVTPHSPLPTVVQKSALSDSLTVRGAPGMMLLLPWDVA